MPNKLPQVTVPLEIPFYDVDAMNVAWHGNYVKYLERARCELLRTFDYDYPQMLESGYLWPIVDMRIKYVGSVLFAQKINVTATLTEYENRLRIDYLIRCAQSGHKLTKAHTIQVAVSVDAREMQFVSPPILLQKLGIKG